MRALITGGSGSGKSEYAEGLLEGRAGKIYLATMRPDGREARERIARHREQRRGRGFETLERYDDIAALTAKELPFGSAALLECMGNLAANELFGGRGGAEEAFWRIEAGITLLESRCADIVVVTNDVFRGGGDYPPEADDYMRLLARVNSMLAKRFELVAELVCGIPLLMKGAGK